MRHLAAGADLRVLRLDEGADLAVGAELRVGAQVGERSDGGALPDHGERRVGARDDGVLADLAVEQRRLRADARAPRHRGGAGDVRARQQLDVFGEGGPQVDPGGRRVDDGDPGQLPAAHDHGVQARGGAGQLHAVVDSLDDPGVRSRNRGDRVAGPAQQRDDVGEVALALIVLRAELREVLAHGRGGEDVGAGVDLGDLELVVGGVALLDDAIQRARRVADDASVAGRVIHDGTQHGRRRAFAAVRLQQGCQGRHVQQRHVAADDDDLTLEVVRQCGEAELDGATGAGDVVLVDEDRLGQQLVDGARDRVALVPHHRHHELGRELAGAGQHVADERHPGERMQHLGAARLHARASPGGQDDHGKTGIGHGVILPYPAETARGNERTAPVPPRCRVSRARPRSRAPARAARSRPSP